MVLGSRSEDGACLPCALSCPAAGPEQAPRWKRESRSGSQAQLEGNCQGDVVRNCCQGEGEAVSEGRARARQTASSLSAGFCFSVEGCWEGDGQGRFDYSYDFSCWCSHPEHNTDLLQSSHSNAGKLM